MNVFTSMAGKAMLRLHNFVWGTDLQAITSCRKSDNGRGEILKNRIDARITRLHFQFQP